MFKARDAASQKFYRNIDFQSPGYRFPQETLSETLIFNAWVAVLLRKLYAKH